MVDLAGRLRMTTPGRQRIAAGFENGPLVDFKSGHRGRPGCEPRWVPDKLLRCYAPDCGTAIYLDRVMLPALVARRGPVSDVASNPKGGTVLAGE